LFLAWEHFQKLTGFKDSMEQFTLLKNARDSGHSYKPLKIRVAQTHK
jgi:hypothetical protein